jgi:hypothetical protein
VLSLCFGASLLTLAPTVHRLLEAAVVVVISLQALSWAMEAVEFGVLTFPQR